MTNPTRLLYRQLYAQKVARANMLERMVREHGEWVKKRFAKQDPRRDEATLEVFLTKDPKWKALIEDQQFANREAQMYGYGALLEALEEQTRLLRHISNQLNNQKV